MPSCSSVSVDLAFKYEVSRMAKQGGECILYNAHTRCAFGSIEAGTHFAQVHVWLERGNMHARGVCRECSVDIPVRFEPRDVELTRECLLLETLDLFFRGHSWHEPACNCPTAHAQARQVHLGSARLHSRKPCSEQCRRQFSEAEIAHELGCSDLLFQIGVKLGRDILVDSKLFYESDGMWQCNFVVHDRASLLQFVLMNPTGVDVSHWYVQYPELRADITLLHRDRMLIVLRNCEDRDRLFPMKMCVVDPLRLMA